MSDWWTVVSAYMGLTELPFPYVPRFRDGTEFELEEFYDLATLWQVYFHRTYRVEPEDRCVIDAGANFGLFSCFLGRSQPNCKIFAIEPIPRTYTRLLDHVRRNQVESQVTCLNLALAGSKGKVTLTSAGAPSQMFHVVTEGEAPDCATVEIDAITLPELLAQIPHERIDLLKMDIEGSEYGVLLSTPSAHLSRIRRISVEYHAPLPGDSADKNDLLHHLRDADFRLSTDDGGDMQWGVLEFTR